MKNEFATYEQALALKELGFDEPCFAFYDESLYFPNNKNQYGTFCNQPLDAASCSAPLKQQVFRWFREKHEIDSNISRDYSLRKVPRQYCYIIQSGDSFEESKNFETYEEAEDACIDMLIETLKKQITNEKSKQ
jgi:hypothetical protein